jgi:L,D-peptidoglycan transpeptidase YkuD (ErfK/YbiS/YcfS/YnhG family)
MRAAFLAAIILLAPTYALAQSCPQPLASARRLVLVTADKFSSTSASLGQFERDAANAPWHEVRAATPALIGQRGVAWARAFARYAHRGEPIKIEGDHRAPIGFFKLGASFGFGLSDRPGYLRIAQDTICVYDLSSPAYNAITSRAKAGLKVRGENMSHVPQYRKGLVVDYPTNARAKAGSCIFVHLQLPGMTGTGGCVALPEPQLVALQDFAQPGAVLAILPRPALGRFKGCLPN